MANEEHLNLLRGWVEGWNKWRGEDPYVRPDLGGAFLRGAQLEYANLSDTYFGHSDLVNTNLRRANLSGADLSGADLSGADLRDANLRDANLAGANLFDTKLANADLTGLTVDADALVHMPVTLQSKWGHTWNIRFGEGGLLKLATSQPRIERSIEFPPEYHEAGTAILSYFATILRDKYPDTPVGVTITQEGHTVKMAIETPEGKREEIERTLNDYGLVVRGEMAATEFLDDQIQILRLENHLRIVEAQLDTQKQIAAFQQADIGALRQLLSEAIASRPEVTLHQSIDASSSSRAHAEQTLTFSQQLAAAQGSLAELAESLPADERADVEDAAKSLETLTEDATPEEIKKTPAASKLRRLAQDLGDEESGVSKALAGVRNGVKIAQDVARQYNAIAQWCGLPVVPEPLVGKK